jgi:hypothetical protein
VHHDPHLPAHFGGGPRISTACPSMLPIDATVPSWLLMSVSREGAEALLDVRSHSELPTLRESPRIDVASTTPRKDFTIFW